VPTESSTKAHLTTIKVPRPLRQRIAGGAAEEGVSAAVFLSQLVDRYERDRRFAQVRRAYAAHDGDLDYADLTQAWDRAADHDVNDAEEPDGA
jgi:hypothetical protein